MKKAGFLTLGCKVNQYESAAIAEKLCALGFEIAGFEQKCDYYIINTCTVTAEADRKSRQMIRRAAKINPEAHIIVAGCYAQVNAEALASIKGVDVVLGSRTKMRVVDKILEFEAGKRASEKIEIESLCNAGFEKMMLDGSFGGGLHERTRAYIKIEDGCDSHCSYCIIPRARGAVSSKAPEDVITEVKSLVSIGYLEVVLTGIETGSYGKDFEKGYDLADLLSEIDRIDGLERIRLGSLDPSIMKPDFVKRLAGIKKLTPHFHLSIQSGCDRILALMKRKYNIDMLMRYMEDIRLHIPNVMFTTDIICGFPGETDEDFRCTCELVKRARFLSAHIFAYSKREGTPAAEMTDQVSAEVSSERVKKLYSIVNETSREMLAEYDKRELTVIPEEYKNGAAHGHTANFIEVSIPCDEKVYEKIHGKLVPVRLCVNEKGVTGEILLQNNDS